MTRIFCTLLTLLLFAAPVHAQATGPWARVIFGSDAGPFDSSGTSSPENVVIACPGSTFRQTDGTAGNVFWVKDGGTGCDDTGWVILSGGGGGGSHNLLSATHSDTTANAVVRGTIITGQAGPTFGRLTPTTTGQVPRYNGTDTLWSLDGSLFEDLNASELTTGTVPDARLSANVSLFGSAVDSSEITDGTIDFDDWSAAECVDTQIPKKAGGVWTCAADEDTGGGGGAPADLSFWTSTAEAGASNETNIGALSTGLLKITVAAGIATPSTATAGTDYVIPAGNVATATALAANGTNCGAGEYATGVDASGNAEGCAVPAGGGGGGDRILGIVVDGGGSTITTGVKGFVVAPVSGTITAATLLSTDASATSCSVVLDVWADTYANYPPTDADSITAAAPPTLSSANKSQDVTLTGWTTSVTAGTVYGFNVDSVTSCTRVTLMLTVQQ